MLHLILSEDWTAGTQAVLSLLSEDVRARRSGRILIVPELISHETERKLCAAAGDTASRYAEVLTFTRLAERFYEQYGIPSRECLDGGSRLVAMAAVGQQLSSQLKAYASVETRPEFLTDLVNAVDEFKRCRIRPEDLKAAAAMTEGSLAQKLEELALLMESYDALCAMGRRDPRDLMTDFLEQLEDSNFAGEHCFYVDGFPDFTRQNMAVLAHLIRESPDITISLNCDEPDSHRLAFEKAGETASILIREAKAVGVEVEIRHITGRADPLLPMRRRLFQGSIEPVSDQSLSVYKAATAWDEVLWAARTIRSLAENGARWRDITLVCTDPGTYFPLISLIFTRMHVPVYLSGTEDILREAVIATVLTALDAALGGFEQADVIRYLRTGLSGMDKNTCDLIENYTFQWGIRGSQWLAEWDKHPDGLGQDNTPASDALLEKLNAARAQYLEPLARLRQQFLAAGRLAVQVEALYAFLTEIRMPDRLCELAAEMADTARFRDAQILDQLWDILMGALEQLYDVLGGTQWAPEHFVRLLKLLLSQYSVGTIPPVLDAVQAGPVNAMRCHSAQHLIVLGANEGALPRYSGSSGILTDQERKHLRMLQVPLTGGGDDGIREEFAEIYGVFCGALSSVRVSCSEAQASFVYRRLSAMAGKEQPADTGIGFAAADRVDAASLLVKEKNRDLAVSLQIDSEYDRICTLKDHCFGRIREENTRALYGQTLRMSASQIDKQAECRLSYFLNYGLHAKERKEITVDPAEFGTYVHDVLEHTCSEIRTKGGFHTVTLEETLSIAHRYSEEYAAARFSRLESERLAYLFNRNLHELDLIVQELWEELSQSEFEPVGFEVDFGNRPDSLPPIRIPGTVMPALVRGFVDRVDAWNTGHQNWYRIVDYKTGKKAFDYCDVYNGIGLQMLLYLFALQESGYEPLSDTPKPAGVQYFPARANYISENSRPEPSEIDNDRKKEWFRSGLLLNDSQVLQAMEPGGEPFRCYKLKKGEPEGNLADSAQLALLKKHVLRTLRATADEIASGVVDPNPYTRGNTHNACSFCPYGSVCRSASAEAGRRNYKTMSKDSFWDALEKEEES